MSTRSTTLLGAFAVLNIIGIVWLVKHQEERRLFNQLAPLMTASALRGYEDHWMPSRLTVARKAALVVAKLKDTGWQTTIGSFQESKNGLVPVFALELGGGRAVGGCTFDSSPPANSGTCTSGSYVDLFSGIDAVSVDEPFLVHLDKTRSYVETLGKASLALGASGKVKVRGKVRMDNRRAIVNDSALMIPEPNDGYRSQEVQEVPIADFVIGETPILRATKSWVFDVSYDMPPILAPMFENGSKLTVVRLEGAVQVDLRDSGFRAEGRLMALNSEIGQASVSYYPGEYASIYVRYLSVPMPFADVCFNIQNALAEVDFREQSLRLGGTMVMQTSESFSCRRGARMGFVAQGLVNLTLEQIRSTLALPETIEARGHFVIDLDDQVVCGDASLYRWSLFHAAYLGDTEELHVWAPKSFSASGVNSDSLFGSSVEIGAKFLFAEPSFPYSPGWQCWPGDPGPRTNFDSLLPPNSSANDSPWSAD